MKKQVLTISNSLRQKIKLLFAAAVISASFNEIAAQEKSWARTTLDDSHVSLDPQNQPWVYYYNKVRSYQSNGTMGPLLSFEGLHFQALKFINNTEFIAAGTFMGTISPGGKTISSKGGRDIFVGKFNTAGQVVWINAFGSSVDEYSIFMNVNANGNISLGGSYAATLKRGNDSLPAGSKMNMFFASCSNSGEFSFKGKLGGSGAELWSVYMTGMTMDPAGNFYTALRFSGDCNIGGVNYSTPQYGTILYKFNAAAQKVWEKSIIAELTLADIEIDKENNVLYAGSFKNTLNIDGQSVTSKGDEDICLFKLGAEGYIHWLKRAGGSSYFDNASSIFITAENEILLSGGFTQEADFDNLKLTSLGEADGFIARYNKAGNAFAVSSIGSDGMDVITESAALGSEVYVVGYHQNSFMWGSAALTGEGFMLGKMAMAMTVGPVHADQPLIYPNPTEGKIKIEYPASFEADKVEVMDISGKIVLSGTARSEMDLELPSGIYFIKTVGKKGSSIQKIAVK